LVDKSKVVRRFTLHITVNIEKWISLKTGRSGVDRHCTQTFNIFWELRKVLAWASRRLWYWRGKKWKEGWTECNKKVQY